MLFRHWASGADADPMPKQNLTIDIAHWVQNMAERRTDVARSWPASAAATGVKFSKESSFLKHGTNIGRR